MSKLEFSVRDGSGGESAGGNVESSVPPVVLERRESHPHLAHYLAVAVQSLFGVLPFIQRQRLRLTMFLRHGYLT